MDEATELRHYTKLDAVLAIFQTQQLRLTRVNKFPDPFEGSVPKKQIDDQLPLSSSRNSLLMTGAHYRGMSTPFPRLDLFTEMTLRRQAKTRSAHAICWTAGPESQAMWRLYCRDGGEGWGVSLQSTLGAVEASVAHHDLFVSAIRYRYYHEDNAFNDELDPFMHKRLGFAHEREVRLLKYDEAHYRNLAAALIREDHTTPPELPEHIFVDWAPAKVIERITISPYADDAYEKRVREAIEAIDPFLGGRLELSVLSPRRYGANF